MKNNKNIQKRTRGPARQEGYSSIIERDILFVILSMLVFSLVGGEANASYLVPSVFTVAAGEFLAAIARKASEPDAVSKGKAYMKKERIFQDPFAVDRETDELPDAPSHTEYTEPFRPDAVPKRSKTKSVPKYRSSPETRTPVSGTKRSASGKIVLAVILIIFIASFSVIIAVLSLVMHSEHEDLHIESGDDDSYTELNFYQQDDFLKLQTDNAFDRLSEGDVEWLQTVGEGDATALIDMIDWENAEIDEDSRYVSASEPQEAIMRYLITCGEQQYKLGFKFTGDNIANDSSDAVITGIAACPFDPWEDYFSDSYEDRSWDDLTDEVSKRTVSVGDISFYGYSILLW